MPKLNMEFTDKSPRQEWLESLPAKYPQKTLLDGAYIRADIVEQMIDDAVEEYRQRDLACWEAAYNGTQDYRK